MDRIIGDFLEINAEILSMQTMSKGLPFISKIRASILRSKLLKRVEKLRNSGLVLNADNLIEYFAYINNRFYPETHFGSVTKCVIDNNIYEALLEFKNQNAIITIDTHELPKFNVKARIILSDYVTRGIDIQTDRLSSDNLNRNTTLISINEVLLNDICDFIVMSIKPYTNNAKLKEINNEVSTKNIQVVIE